MATLKEIRQELVALRESLKGQKGGLTVQKWDDEEGWYKYAITTSEEMRKKVTKIISVLDKAIG